MLFDYYQFFKVFAIVFLLTTLYVSDVLLDQIIVAINGNFCYFYDIIIPTH